MAEIQFKVWLKEHGFSDLLSLIIRIERVWRDNNNGSRKSWPHLLSGNAKGDPYTICGILLPVLAEARRRTGKIPVKDAVSRPDQLRRNYSDSEIKLSSSEVPILDNDSIEPSFNDGKSTLTTKPLQMSVEELIKMKIQGQLFLPSFQRDFVWASTKVQKLFDSLKRHYPIGTILVWRPTWNEEDGRPVATKRWALCEGDANTGIGKYPDEQKPRPGAAYVLDGQQRLTSIFRIVFKSVEFGSAKNDPHLAVQLTPTDEPFFIMTKNHKGPLQKKNLIIDAHALFAGVRGEKETATIHKYICNWVSPTDQTDEYNRAMDIANKLRNSILNSNVLVYEIESPASDSSIEDIFARLNQEGSRLRAIDLTKARIAAFLPDFNDKAEARLKEPEFKGYTSDKGNKSISEEMILKTALFLGTREHERARKHTDGEGAVPKIVGYVSGPDVEKLVGKKSAYQLAAKHFDAAVDGLKNAVGIFKSAGIYDPYWLPSPPYALLVVAVASVYETLHDPKWWLGWTLAIGLWRGHYGNSEKLAQEDANLAADGNYMGLIRRIKNKNKRPNSILPDEQDFTGEVVEPEGVRLAQLIKLMDDRENNISFPTGKRFSSILRDIYAGEIGPRNPLEEHHIFPIKYVGKGTSNISPHRVGNIALITGDDNASIGSKMPLDYLSPNERLDQKVINQILKAHDIPHDKELWTLDRYKDFCFAREKILAKSIRAMLEEMLGSTL